MIRLKNYRPDVETDHVVIMHDGFLSEKRETIMQNDKIQVLEVRMLSDMPFVFGTRHLQMPS